MKKILLPNELAWRSGQMYVRAMYPDKFWPHFAILASALLAALLLAFYFGLKLGSGL